MRLELIKNKLDSMKKDEKEYLAFYSIPDDKKINFSVVTENIAQALTSVSKDTLIVDNQEIAIISNPYVLSLIKGRFSFFTPTEIDVDIDGKLGIIFKTHAPQILSTVMHFVHKN